MELTRANQTFFMMGQDGATLPSLSSYLLYYDIIITTGKLMKGRVSQFVPASSWRSTSSPGTYPSTLPSEDVTSETAKLWGHHTSGSRDNPSPDHVRVRACRPTFIHCSISFFPLPPTSIVSHSKCHKPSPGTAKAEGGIQEDLHSV